MYTVVHYGFDGRARPRGTFHTLIAAEAERVMPHAGRYDGCCIVLRSKGSRYLAGEKMVEERSS